MKRIFIFLFLINVYFTPHAQNLVPKVIPALQSWKSTKGIYTVPEKGFIYVNKKDSCLLYNTAKTLSEDLKCMFGYDYKVTVSENKREAKSILLSLNEDISSHGEESYKIDINKRVEITAPHTKGVFWGTRTLLQMIYNQPNGLQKGCAIDFPRYKARGFMLDAGRKFFSMDFLKDYIKIMAFYKMNEFHIHLNDNGFVEFAGGNWNNTYSAFRLESRVPGLTSKDGYYTKKDFKQLQKTAITYGIKIIPEIDVPAHSLAFTHCNPNLAASNSAEYGFDHLDLYKKEVYEFLDSLFDEYLSGDDPVFVGPEVHIGTDEYNTKEAEQFRHFTNHYIELIKKYGKTPRLWGSLNSMKGKTNVDLKGTVVSAWNYWWMDLETAINAGAKVVNMCDQFLYIVPAVDYYHDFLDCKWLYNNWTPEMMREGHKINKNPNLLGAMFAVWNDRIGNGISEQDVHVRCFPAMQLLSDKLWKGENQKYVPYEEFEALCKAMPEAPGVNLSAKVAERVVLTGNDREIILNGNDTIHTSVAEIGYPYAVEFELYQDSLPAIDAILFKGPHSEFIANWQNTGKLAFRRDGYEFVFHNFKLANNSWTKIRIEGDIKGTTLIVDGEIAERLEGRTKVQFNKRNNKKIQTRYQETLIFPLQTIGDVNMGFKGRIKNVVCTPM